MKKVRKPTPFPPPDEEICEHFGRTMYYAQKLEKEFKLFLLTAEALGEIKIDKKDFKNLKDFLSRQNLGGLIKTLREGNGLLDKKLKEQLYLACDDRNKLAHAFLQTLTQNE